MQLAFFKLEKAKVFTLAQLKKKQTREGLEVLENTKSAKNSNHAPLASAEMWRAGERSLVT
jgi:hypothetical protein